MPPLPPELLEHIITLALTDDFEQIIEADSKANITLHEYQTIVLKLIDINRPMN